MGKFINDIGDDEIRIIGMEEEKEKKPRKRKVVWIVLALVVVLIIGIVLVLTFRQKSPSVEAEQGYFENVQPTEPSAEGTIGMEVDTLAKGFTEIKDTTINDIPLRLYIPRNATMSLHVGRINPQDSTIIYAAQAADVRRDNKGIVGAFVLEGEPLSWGISKKGFCASIDGKTIIGVAENTPLFEEATEKKGYFFRQYPLVDNGQLVENEPKGKSIRRGICDRGGEIFMVETETPESFHDFAQALVDLGVFNAIYLVGSAAPYGWAVDQDGKRHEFGDDTYYRANKPLLPNISYVVWRRK